MHLQNKISLMLLSLCVALGFVGCQHSNIDKSKELTSYDIRVDYCTYYPVQLPIDEELLGGNYDTYWDFEHFTLSLLASKPLECDDAVQVGNKWLVLDYKPLDEEAGYTSYPNVILEGSETFGVWYDWDDEEEFTILEEIPSQLETNPTQFFYSDGAYSSASTESITDSVRYVQISDVNEYYYEKKVYEDFSTCISSVVSDMSVLFNQNIHNGYYRDGAVFYQQLGDYTVAVKYINLNTQLLLYGKGNAASAYIWSQCFA